VVQNNFFIAAQRTVSTFVISGSYFQGAGITPPFDLLPPLMIRLSSNVFALFAAALSFEIVIS
jgi:hypothetical protein